MKCVNVCNTLKRTWCIGDASMCLLILLMNPKPIYYIIPPAIRDNIYFLRSGRSLSPFRGNLCAILYFVQWTDYHLNMKPLCLKRNIGYLVHFSLSERQVSTESHKKLWNLPCLCTE